MKKPILLIINAKALNYKYWYSLNPTKIYSETRNIENILDKYPNAIKLCFNDTSFQIIVEK